MNASGVPNACKSNGKTIYELSESGGRVSNTLVTYPGEGDNRWKRRLIPRTSSWLESDD